MVDVPSGANEDRKSTRLNSSHDQISYAVFCLKKKSTRLNSSHDQMSYAVFCLKKKDDQHRCDPGRPPRGSHAVAAVRKPQRHARVTSSGVYWHALRCNDPTPYVS